MNILFQGDSITDGLRNKDDVTATGALGTGYAFITSALLMEKYPDKDLKFYNRAVRGNRITDILARWKVDSLNMNPDFMFLYDGINDLWHEYNSGNGVSLNLYDRVYRTILDLSFEQNPELKVVLIEPYYYFFGLISSCNNDEKAWSEFVPEYSRIVNEVASDYTGVVEVIHTQKLFDHNLARAPKEFWSLDGVHPSPAGHQLLANECERILEQYI